MDEPTLGDALRARPPADPSYRPNLDPERPGSRRTGPSASSAPRRTGWTRAVLTLGLVGVLAAGVVVVIGSSPVTTPIAGGSDATPPIRANGPIAYDRDGDLWIAGPDGGDARPLTTGPVNDRAPSWSPDGRWIAYWHGDGADLELRVVRRDGSADRLVASGLLEVGQLSWEAFGRLDEPLLTYVLRQPDPGAGGERVILRTIVGRDRPPEPIALPGTAPAWSPDGMTLAYLTDSSDGQLTFRSEDDGSIVWQWPTGFVGGPTDSGAPPYRRDGFPVADAPTWSPDGTRLALAAGAPGDRDIVVRDASGSIGARWSTPSDEWSPTWSPDGRRLAWLRRDPLRTVIQVAAADGSGQSSPVQVDDNVTSIAWAPDGDGWLLTRPGAVDLMTSGTDGVQTQFTIDAPLSSGIVSWLAVPVDG